MPGTQELLIYAAPFIVAVGIALAAVARLRKKLAVEASPTVGTCVNEIGGYVIAGIIALAFGIYLLVAGDSTLTDPQPGPAPSSTLSQPSSERSNNDSPTDDPRRLDREHVNPSLDLLKPSVDLLQNQRTASDVRPKEILRAFVGEWRIVTDDKNAPVRAVASPLKDELWILWRTYTRSGHLHGLALLGYDQSSKQFIHDSVEQKERRIEYTGKWIAKEGFIRWHAELPNGFQHRMEERVTPDSITNRMTWLKQADTVHESTLRLERVSPPSRKAIAKSELLNSYLGLWMIESTTEIPGQPPRTSRGRLLVTRVDGQGINVERMLNSDGTLKSLFVVSVQSPTEFRRQAISNQGKLLDMVGTWNDSAKTMSWVPIGGGDEAAPMTEHFQSSDAIESTMVVRDADGKVSVKSTDRLTRISPKAKVE